MPIPEVREKRRKLTAAERFERQMERDRRRRAREFKRITKIITDAVGSNADQRIRNFLNAAKH
jgi:hypothetical protein